jgi:site-specific DNA-methyltransferase (adenine-specific)
MEPATKQLLSDNCDAPLTVHNNIEQMKDPVSIVTNEDCMVMMGRYPDKYFDLAICDPPYFSGPEKRKYYGKEFSSHGVKRIEYKPLENSWSVPDEKYYQELLRVSKHQIIWGINYYNFSDVPVGRIVWDKCSEESSFSDCELASCSKIKSVRIFRYMWKGMMQGSGIRNGAKMQGNKDLNEKKIHPTQKPLALYYWLLKKYGTKGDNILDTHLGSGGSRIAAYKLGFNFYGCELDEHYFIGQEARFKKAIAEPLFDQVKLIQERLFD